MKLIDEELKKKKKKNKSGAGLLKDDRFKALFENPDFEVDKNAEEYRFVFLLICNVLTEYCLLSVLSF